MADKTLEDMMERRLLRLDGRIYVDGDGKPRNENMIHFYPMVADMLETVIKELRRHREAATVFRDGLRMTVDNIYNHSKEKCLEMAEESLKKGDDIIKEEKNG